MNRMTIKMDESMNDLFLYNLYDLMVKFWIDDGSDYICVNMLKTRALMVRILKYYLLKCRLIIT